MRRLAELYQQDQAGCQAQAGRLWGNESAGLIARAAERSEWDDVVRELRALRAEQNSRALKSNRLRVLRRWTSGMMRAALRWWRADRGLSVAFLGPDGCGKSSVVDAVRRNLAPAFVGTERRTFPPGLLRRATGSNESPHAQRPRSFLSSSVRAVFYWLTYCTLGHLWLIRPAIARGTLVVHDRHLVDALVDPRRYRYGGPAWLLRVIWRLVPKPDLVILLDAPADVIQARKQEVSAGETCRQLAAYRRLVSAMPNGHVVDAAMPLEEVVAAVQDLILGHLARRAEQQLRLEARP
jgi:thymidylate kinase